MYQVTFSDESAKVFQKLPQERQLKLVGALVELTPKILEEAKEPLSKFKRADTFYFRYRIEGFRFYFVLKGEEIFCITILNKNSWGDFLLRNNLEKMSETEIESKPEFLKLLGGD